MQILGSIIFCETTIYIISFGAITFARKAKKKKKINSKIGIFSNQKDGIHTYWHIPKQKRFPKTKGGVSKKETSVLTAHSLTTLSKFTQKKLN